MPIDLMEVRVPVGVTLGVILDENVEVGKITINVSPKLRDINDFCGRIERAARAFKAEFDKE